jgi:hypothetical protein
MDPKRMEPRPEHEELHNKRKELHGKHRRLHEQLSDVCEEFVLSDMTKEHKQKGSIKHGLPRRRRLLLSPRRIRWPFAALEAA